MLARMKKLCAQVVLAGVLGMGGLHCIADNEAIVLVEPSIEQPAVTVNQGALGTGLTGSFQLKLMLGPRASGPSSVNIDKFELVSADQSKSLVATLEAKSTQAFPVSVELDSEQSLPFTIDFGAMLLPANAYADICGAGGVRIKGSIRDSLKDGPTPCVSDVVMPAGCMP